MNRTIEEIIISYLNGESSTADLQQLKAWLSADSENVAEFNACRRQYIGAKSAIMSADQIAEAEKLQMAKIAFYEAHRRRVAMFRRWVAGTAAAVLLLVGAGLFFSRNYSIIERDNRITAFAPHDSIRTLVLPDGTKVWLNQMAMIKYPEHFDKDCRKVEIEGEAYFEVTKDASRPFVVHSEQMDITVLGTTFNVQCFRGSKNACSSLISGKVQVVGNHGEGRIILKPGQRANLDGENRQLTVQQDVNTGYDAVWHNNLIPFDNASVEQVAHALEHFYGVEVNIRNPKGHNHTYSGVIKRTGDVDSTLWLLKNAMPIEYSRTNKSITITIQ
ncbi:MAG: FecR domain-containing protein [Muribaculaceae bacterium]